MERQFSKKRRNKLKSTIIFENKNDFIFSDKYDGQLRKTYSKTCSCGKKFYLPAHKYAKQKFCSPTCPALVNRYKIQVSCAYKMCENKFFINVSRFKKSKSGLFFCCNNHKNITQQLDGDAKIHLPHYTNLEQSKAYRKKIFRLIKKKCARCGYAQEEQMLDVHHKDGDRSNNKIENLEILCLWCHALETRGVEPHDWDGQLPEETVVVTTKFLENLSGASSEIRTRN